jgi:cytochrome P450
MTTDATTTDPAPTSADLMLEISEAFAGSLKSDPYPLFAQRRRETPVMDGDIMKEFGTPSMAAGFDGSRRVFTFFKYADILAALKDVETYSSRPMLEALGPLLGKVATGLDGEEHKHLRAVLMPAVARENFPQWENEIINPVIQDLAAKLPEQGPHVDLTEFAIQFPVRIIYEILGFPKDDHDLYELFQVRALTILLGFGTTNPKKADQAQANKMRAVQAVQGLYDDLMPIVQRRRAEGSQGNDFIGHLLRAENDGITLTDDEIVILARSLLPAAAETTTRSWSNLLVCLLQHPEVLEEVRNDRSLVPKAINEAVRYESTAVTGARLTTRDVEVAGVQIPAGSGITLVRASGNRDEDAFPDPDTFDIHRKTSKLPLSFGFGAHMCIGMNIAKLEMAAALNAVLDVLPGLRVDPDAEPLFITGVTLRGARTLPVLWG